MTHQDIFYLKFCKGVSTYELMQRFPEHVDRVSEVALMDIPEMILKEVIQEEAKLNHIIRLKNELSALYDLKTA